MLIFDELKKNDLQLRTVAMVFAGGFFILLIGLWWLQVVSAGEYQSHQQTQSYRSVRLPAVRGKILDRTGVNVLAENRPRYNLSLFLEDLSNQFKDEYQRMRPVIVTVKSPPFWKFWSNKKTMQTNYVRLKQSQIDALAAAARYAVANSVVNEVGLWLAEPIAFDAKKFDLHYKQQLAMPYPILPNLNDAQIARFEEHYSGGLGVDLEPQFIRVYPFGMTAAHLLGYLREDDSSVEGEESFFNYRLPDYRGVVGIEGGYDAELRGRAGGESVLVNNLGYRESENVWSRPEAGHNITLTLDLGIQLAAESSLAAHEGADARGAVVVMDVRTGDVLALVSSPAINPDFRANDPARLADPALRPQINRATQENYSPGSIFKVVTGLAALENGLNPDALFDNPGYIYVGKRRIKDLAAPGEYNFRRAIVHSSNSYFITNGLSTGIDKIVRLAEKFHFGETSGLRTRQETRGNLPSLARVHGDWFAGDTANVCIGQGKISVTPLQMAVAYAAIANGGKVLWPRLVARMEPQDPASTEAPTNFPEGVVRDELGVRASSLKILQDAMLAETEDPEGTGQAARVPGMRICGKTGTAQIENARNQVTDHTTWFASFAPYENPKYAVVVMVEGGVSGGSTCAPIAHDIYEAILKEEKSNAPPVAAGGKYK